jgi:hypothetical protein
MPYSMCTSLNCRSASLAALSVQLLSVLSLTDSVDCSYQGLNARRRLSPYQSHPSNSLNCSALHVSFPESSHWPTSVSGTKESLTRVSSLVAQFCAGQSLFRNAPDFECTTVVVHIGKRHTPSRNSAAHSPMVSFRLAATGRAKIAPRSMHCTRTPLWG